ncbi:MAG: hypothetical protein KDC67_11270, partial [Ignavibacteriae bacterium]|nr:hypothetical protein [Ignavibacteriota bacterium]
CGYHKTGSSFLQTVFAKNREYLLSNKIYYPISKYDKDMLEAKISPGNGMELVTALRNKDNSKILDLLESWIKDAHKNNADLILLSSEGFFHTFSNNKLLELFTDCCKQLAITAIDGLLFYRDPLDHALSVYKHRGKNGKISSFNEWINNHYETLMLTGKFLDFFKDFSINWSFRKYNSNSLLLNQAVFNDWLKIESPKIDNIDRVNVSLTLSEVLTISRLKNVIPDESIKDIYTSLITIPVKTKPNENPLKEYYSRICYEVFKKDGDIIEKINNQLPEKEHLIVHNVSSDKQLTESAILSTTQLDIIFKSIKRSKSFNILYRTLLNKVKKIIVKVLKIKRV